MIASLRGRVLQVAPGSLVIEVGGVGLRAEVTADRHTGVVPGDEVMLHTALVVREDALTLYGFDSAEELEMFEHLIAVTGVGPRSALGILSAMTPRQIAQAVVDDDARPFRKVSGIGPKTSKLILVSLSGKLTPEAFGAPEAPVESVPDSSGPAATVTQGLMGLGWPEAVAEQAVSDALAAGAPEDQAGLLRAALALVQSGAAKRGMAR